MARRLRTPEAGQAIARLAADAGSCRRHGAISGTSSSPGLALLTSVHVVCTWTEVVGGKRGRDRRQRQQSRHTAASWKPSGDAVCQVLSA